MIIYLFIFLVTLYLFYFKWNHYKKYTRNNLRGPTPLPIIGNFFDLWWRPFYQYERENFKKYGNTYVDYTFTRKGCIVTSNPDWVKRILIKDFSNFYYKVQPRYLPEYARRTLIFLNEDWKRVRSQVSPVFTATRLRLMYNNFDYPIENCMKNIDQLIDQKLNGDVNVKALMKGLALDNIANVVFSLKTNTFKNDDFAQKVNRLFARNTSIVGLSFVLPAFMCKYFDLSIFNSETVEYFGKLTTTLMEERKKNKNVVYNDFIEMLTKSEVEGDVKMQTEADGHINRELSTEEIVGQCLVFFSGGMETVSTSLTLILLELALNQEIQDKLYKDLIACYPDEKVLFDDIKKSKYLDCVVNESLRMHPAVNRIFRVARDDYIFANDLKVKKGQVLGVSLYNLHHDPQFYSEPDRFRPERFLEDDINLDTLYPFGTGSRNCVAERFALLELKSLLITLIKKFKVTSNDKTLTFKYKNAIIINMVNDLRLKFERRN